MKAPEKAEPKRRRPSFLQLLAALWGAEDELEEQRRQESLKGPKPPVSEDPEEERR